MTSDTTRLPRLYKPRAAASALSIALNTLRKLTAAGKIQCIKVTDKSVRYSEEALREYLQSRGAS